MRTIFRLIKGTLIVVTCIGYYQVYLLTKSINWSINDIKFSNLGLEGVLYFAITLFLTMFLLYQLGKLFSSPKWTLKWNLLRDQTIENGLYVVLLNESSKGKLLPHLAFYENNRFADHTLNSEITNNKIIAFANIPDAFNWKDIDETLNVKFNN